MNEKKQTWLTLPINARFGLKIKEITMVDKTWENQNIFLRLPNAYKRTKYFYEILIKFKIFLKK